MGRGERKDKDGGTLRRRGAEPRRPKKSRYWLDLNSDRQGTLWFAEKNDDAEMLVEATVSPAAGQADTETAEVLVAALSQVALAHASNE